MNVMLSGDVDVINQEVRKSNSTVVIWGAGACAASFLCNCGFNQEFDYFIDGNESKCGTEFLNKEIYGIDKLLSDNNEEMIVIIATMYFKSVISKLEELGYKGKVYSAFHVDYKMGQGNSIGLEENYEKLIDVLSDDRSKEIVSIILEKRQRLDIDYSDICEGNQYFLDDIIKKEEDAVFVDGGAFDGDTVDQFITFQNNKFKKVFSFEMDLKNYMKIDKGRYDSRIEFLNYGLWSEKKVSSYNSDSTSSSLGDGGDMIAKCVSIDEICKEEKVSFIKMDIEGAEIPALIGAKDIILQNKPQLAICVYHKPDDIFEIPFMLKEWVPEYKFYIRHHSDNFTETVLYAI